jgi:hypothetical protein
MLNKLDAVIRKGKVSTVIKTAQFFGIIPDKAAIALDVVEKAPAPKTNNLSNNWVHNLDVLAEMLGCLVASSFDVLVDGLSNEEMSALDPERVVDSLGVPMARTYLLESWEMCLELYVENGSLSKQVEAGIIPAGGLVTRAVLMPFVKQQQAKQKVKRKSPLSKLLTG